MQIHELNNYMGNLDDTAFVAVDNGNDTGRASIANILAGVNNEIDQVNDGLSARIDNIIAGGDAPSVAEVTDARLGGNGITYASLGDAIRGQYNELQGEIDDITSLVQVEINMLDGISYTDESYYSTGYGNIASGSAYGVYASVSLKANTKYTIRNMQKDFSWVKTPGVVGVQIKTLPSYADNGDGTITFTSPSVDSTLYLTTYSASYESAFVKKGTSIPGSVTDSAVLIPNLKRDSDSFLNSLMSEVEVHTNMINGISYTSGKYYSTGYGNIADNALLGIFDPFSLEPDTTYTIRAVDKTFTWVKQAGQVGTALSALPSFIDNGDNTYTFTTPNVVTTLYCTIADANAALAYLTDYDSIPSGAPSNGFVVIPDLIADAGKENVLYVSKSYNSGTDGFGVTKFDNVIDAVNSITDSSESKPYTVLVEAGTKLNPIVYDDWNTKFGGHVAGGAGYVGVSLPSYVTITTSNPTHPETTVFYFDGHAGISDTMTYNDAYKKCLFHVDGRKKGVLVEGVTLRSKDCRYAFHPESGSDGYLVSWELKNCIIDWQGSPHASETGWAGTVAVGVGLGYGGTGRFTNCKWITNAGVDTAIGGHTNGWNPGVLELPVMPGATIEISNCDMGGYNVFMQNSVNENELNNILDFYNVVNCSGNDSTGWAEILRATAFA